MAKRKKRDIATINSNTDKKVAEHTLIPEIQKRSTGGRRRVWRKHLERFDCNLKKV